MPSLWNEAMAALMRSRQSNKIYVYSQTVQQQQQSFEERSFRQLIDLYTSLIDVRIIEDFIAHATAKIPVKVVNSADRELTNTNRLSLLIDKTNPSQNWTEIVRELSVFYGLTGNAFMNIYSDYLYTLSPADVKINLGAPVELPEYMNYVASYDLELSGVLYPIQEQEMFHMKMSQLKGDNGIWAWGSSPYSAAIPVLEALEANYSSRVSLITDRGALGMLTNESEIPDREATKEVQDALNDYGTMKGQKKYIASTEKLKWQQMSQNTKDLQLMEQTTHDFGMLCSLRGLDPLIFSASGSTYANQEQGIQESYRRAIIPFAKQLYQKLSEFTKYHFGGLSFSPDWASVEELQDTGEAFSTKVIAELQAGILTAEQSFNMLYEELDIEFEADDEKERNRQMMLDMVMQNRENGQPKEEEVEIENAN